MNLLTVYPGQPIWVEGQAFPTGNLEVDRGLNATKETYNFYKTAFNYLSYDNKNGPMDIAIDLGIDNAFAVGKDLPQLTVFGLNATVDDIVADEWTHNLTASTDELVYQYQPGALNESISDIVGETLDRINSDGPFPGVDAPNNPRSNGACTILGGNNVLSLVINSPTSIAGTKPVGRALFGPAITAPVSGTVVLVNDGVNVTSNACEPLINPDQISGKIALVDRGNCDFSFKVKTAQDADAIAVIIVNNAGNNIQYMPGGAEANNVTIPSIFLGQSNGQIIKNALATNTISVTINPPLAGTDNSIRWLLNEDTTAIRDMYNQICFGDPGKVQEGDFYTCSATADSGGVHANSGISNHAYALLVDGGTYNNQNIRGIGLTKAFQIYIRAKLFYQHAATQFTDHADALEQSCRDLTGGKVRDLKTGALLNQNKITADDCKQVSKVIAAVEFRKTPPCTNQSNLLSKNPPKLCPFGTHKEPIFVENFQNEPKKPQWSVSYEATDPSGFTPRKWELQTGGKKFGSPTPLYQGREIAFSLELVATGASDDCFANQAGILHLDSPKIHLPRDGSPIKLSLRHWVNMPDDYYPAEGGAFDGENLKISVNGGPYQLVDSSAFTFNPYNTVLFSGDVSDNPMAGQPAYSGGDVQLVDPFYRSLINLSQYARPGDTIRLRFDVGTDFCTSTNFAHDDIGWYLKKVTLYQCKPGHPNNPHYDDDD